MMPVQETSPDGCRAQFGAKVQGLMVLDQLLCGKELDFCIVTSSMSSVLGGLGFSTYAAANLFMDAFAHHHAQTGGLPWTSINFGSWDFAIEAKARTRFCRSRCEIGDHGRRGCGGVQTYSLRPPGNANHRFDQGPDQPGLMSGKTREILRDADQSLPAESAICAAISSSYSRPNLANAYTAPSNDLQRTIAGIWQELLGIEQIGLHDNFFELGGHSLLATQIISRIRNAFSIEVPLRRVFEVANGC